MTQMHYLMTQLIGKAYGYTADNDKNVLAFSCNDDSVKESHRLYGQSALWSCHAMTGNY